MEQHIIIGTVMAIISHGRFSPSPGSFSSLVGTAGQPAGRKRMRMRNGVDWIKSSLRRSDAGQLHFLRKKFPPLIGSRTNLGTIRKISINKCYK